MPPDLKSDYCLATHEAWQYAARQMRTEEMVVFVNTKDSEKGYPYIKSELRFRYRVPPFIHPQPPTTVSAAFGNFMYSKLVRTLRSPILIVRQRSVAWAVELLSVGENRARCIAAGFVPILAGILREKDMHIRQNLALCFKHLAEAGQNVCGLLCMLDVIKALINMVASENRVLRGNAFQALQALSQMSHLVRFELVKEGTVLTFILRRINDETEQAIKISALEVLSKCISGANYNEKALEELLAVNAVPTAVRFIRSPWRNLQESACRFLCLLCMHNTGKAQAVECQAVGNLVELLSDIEPRVQAFACAALCCYVPPLLGAVFIFASIYAYYLYVYFYFLGVGPLSSSVSEGTVSTTIQLLKHIICSHSPCFNQGVIFRDVECSLLQIYTFVGSITIDIQGKKDFVMVQGIPILLKLLDLTDEQLCLFDIALLLNVAEWPKARAELFKDGLVALREIIKTSTSPLIKKRSKQGLQQLHFQHLPYIFPYDKMDKMYLRGPPVYPARTLAESYSSSSSPHPGPFTDRPRSPPSATSKPMKSPTTSSTLSLQRAKSPPMHTI